MKELSLEAFAAKVGQSEAARLLGVSAPAISKALSAKRQIFVMESDDGSVRARELREFPCQKPQKQPHKAA
jgi:predicted transcriptional regulator